ncbi:MAG: hypothetical protein DMF74_02505 [Acidobacteria bacterium]|nr:MAG: hypothetical protein DMF74_02505 [Acidobacteriota bacterium]
MTLIKICGITNLEDACAAIDAGADMLGFNFYRPSPRFIEPSHAREIIRTESCKRNHRRSRVRIRAFAEGRDDGRGVCQRSFA